MSCGGRLGTMLSGKLFFSFDTWVRLLFNRKLDRDGRCLGRLFLLPS